MKHKYLVLCFVLSLLVSCSSEVARIQFNKNLDSESCKVTITEKQKIELWTDLDIQYTDPFSLVYEIELLKDDKSIYEKICNAFDIDYEKFSVKTQVNKKHSIKYQGRLKSHFGELEKGSYTVVVKPVVKGKEFTLKKIDIFIAK